MIRLNLGSCDLPLEGWTNVDLSTSSHIKADIIADATDLSKHFKPGTVDEIFASHLLEHFYPEEADKAMKHWYELLKPGGKLGLVVPDFKHIAEGYINGDMDLKTVNDLYIYSYVQESHHRYCYDQASLFELFSKHGFTNLKPINRMEDPRITYGVAWQVGVDAIK